MISLARRLRLADFFWLGFGTMFGGDWLVVMDDWLLRGGPLGAVLAFVIGGLVLLFHRIAHERSSFLSCPCTLMRRIRASKRPQSLLPSSYGAPLS